MQGLSRGSQADLKLASARRSYCSRGPCPRARDSAMEAALLFEEIGELARAKMALDLSAEIECALARRATRVG